MRDWIKTHFDIPELMMTGLLLLAVITMIIASITTASASDSEMTTGVVCINSYQYAYVRTGDQIDMEPTGQICDTTQGASNERQAFNEQ